MIRLATEKDIGGIAAVYDLVLRMEEQGLASIGWRRGVYPTEDTARQGVERGDMYVFEDDGTGGIAAAAVINHAQPAAYSGGKWGVAADGGEVLVLHTLAVSPGYSGRGIGTAFVDFYERMAKEKGCRTLRMDTQAKNAVARRLHRRLGYREAGIVECEFNGIEGIELVLLEKVLG